MLLAPLVRFASGHVPDCRGTLVTFTEIVQLEAVAVVAGTVTPETLIVLPPPVAVIDPPVQLFTIAGVAAICSLLGNVSMKLTTCAGRFGGGLVSVNVSVVIPPGAMVVGLNDFVSAVPARTAVVAVALLLAWLVSVVVFEAATVAVLVIVPLAPAGTLSVTLYCEF